MKILLVFSLFLVSVGGGESRTVRGYPGGGVLIRCRYKTKYTSNPKYLCKGAWSSCDDQIRTGDKNEWRSTGRFSLLDNTSSAEFWVIIRDLTVQDSGLYQCGVDKDLAIDKYTPVELTVEEVGGGESRTVRGYAGGGVLIRCRYETKYTSNPKYLCKRPWANCADQIKTGDKNEWRSTGRFSLLDNPSSAEFWVMIRDLTVQDSGTYKCGVDIELDFDINTPVKLTVEEGSSGPPPPSPSSSTARPTLQSTSTPISSTSKPTETSTPQTKASEGSMVIVVVSVILAVLLIGLLLLIVTLQKKRKTQGAAPTQSLPLKDSSKAPTSTYDYDKIKGRSDAGDSIVYTTVDHRPTDLSEPSQNLYGNVQLPSGPSERSNPVYCSVSAKPDEGPTYATVSFDKNTGSSTDGASTGTSTKDDTSCEYATEDKTNGQGDNTTGMETKYRQGNKRQARTKGTTWGIKQQGLTRDTWEGAEPETVGGEETKTVTGYPGGDVLIECEYKTNYTSNPKYLCKGPWSNCTDRIRTGTKNEWSTRGRFMLYDDTRAVEFRVKIRDLTVEDSGLYHCGVDVFWLYDVYTPVELTVKHAVDKIPAYREFSSELCHGRPPPNLDQLTNSLMEECLNIDVVASRTLSSPCQIQSQLLLVLLEAIRHPSWDITHKASSHGSIIIIIIITSCW
ncbi:hypothetical protein NFI96_008909 [Prochilodus magdalenae]|nr:hypothetical protein NFI96_008909 [Prochilodus magdalenae]